MTMNKPEKHCLSLDCPERRSVCCSALSEAVSGDEGTGYFRCKSCHKEFIGGECNAPEPLIITQEDLLEQINEEIKKERKIIGEEILRLANDEDYPLTAIERYADHLITGQEND